jgi:prepilin-type N-terminal cleavage/methylation domain-containing protein
MERTRNNLDSINMKKNLSNYNNLGEKGFTLTEIIVVLGITGIIMIALGSYQVGVLKNNKYLQDSLTNSQDSRTILRTIVKELRSASPSNNGSFAITQAGTSSISFFSDTDGDGTKDQIRYYISSNLLKKGLIIPTGSPFVYNSANETISTLASNIVNGTSSPIFEYYDNTYAGTSSPLVQPVTISAIKLVKINLIIDNDINNAPPAKTYSSQVNIRNLKDNL